MPLLGERLVAFLSDGAFEEQRGSDWAPRWWRASDSGFAVPAMVLNGRRIEQRTEISQEGGLDWLVKHLTLSGFDPIIVDGHDPLSYAWGILEAEARLSKLSDTDGPYPARLPYLIAPCIKGFGFPGLGEIARTISHWKEIRAPIRAHACSSMKAYKRSTHRLTCLMMRSGP